MIPDSGAPDGRDAPSDARSEPDAPAPPSDAQNPGPPDVAPSDDCTGNERRCLGDNVQTCNNGQFETSEECLPGFLCSRGNCIPGEGTCQPGSGRCISPDTYEVCAADGQSYGEHKTCASGSTCEGGRCVSACDRATDKMSNLGCQYLSLRLDQVNGTRNQPHSVVVSNPGDQPATVSVSSPGTPNLNMPDRTIAPQQSAVINFPVSPMINRAGLSQHVYILDTDQPVIATQFAPLNNPGAGSETSDATLLLPTNALGTEHVVLNWRGPKRNFIQAAGTYIDVIAIEDNTTVQISGPRALTAGALGSMAANSTQTFAIPRHQVLHLVEDDSASDSDVSGTIITSNYPVAVFAGASIVEIPDQPVETNPPAGCTRVNASCTQNADCCTGICGYGSGSTRPICRDRLNAGDHVEQQLFPTETWGTSYIATPFHSRGINDFVIYKVTAARDNTRITVDPPVNGISNLTLNRGQVHQFHSPNAFELNATDAIMVAQFMIGGTNSQSGKGDPAFLLPPANQQFRDNYVFLVPDHYALNFVTLIAPTGVDVQLDGTTIAASTFTPVGGTSTWSYKLVEAVAGGVHRASADEPFGVVVHGMDTYISYAFSGGITLSN